MDGGGNFRANFGVERDGVSLLAEDGSHSKGADITTGYPEFDHVLLKKLGWWSELTEDEQKAARAKADAAYQKLMPGLLQTGADFASVAQEYSEDPDTAVGPVIDARARENLYIWFRAILQAKIAAPMQESCAAER